MPDGGAGRVASPSEGYRSLSEEEISPELAELTKKSSGQKNSRRLWRSRTRKSSSVPEGAAYFPAAVFLAGKCLNLGRDSISCCRTISEEFSSQQRRNLPENFSSKEFWTATAFSSFLKWGQNDYLPNFYSRRMILRNCMCFLYMIDKVKGIQY